MDIITPESEEALAEAIAETAGRERRLRITGHGTRSGLGAPVAADAVLRTTELKGVEEYQPEELTFTALAGTPLAEIEAMLAQRRQMLPFEPPRFAEVLAAYGAQQPPATETAGAAVDHSADDAGTLGGVVSVGMAGPRQILRWSVRDHVLGFSAVNGRGELFKAGGRVVKNVTGYDLPKLMSASFGTLAVLTRLTVRVLPAPERAITLTCRGLDAPAAVAAMSRAMLTPAEVSAACWLPETLVPAALKTGAPEDATGGGTLTCLRVEGFAGSLKSRAEMLRAAMQGHGDWTLAEGEAWDDFWAGLRDVRPMLAGAAEEVPEGDAGRHWLWRITLAPASGGKLAAALMDKLQAAHLFIDRAGGLIWLSLPLPALPDAADGAEALRRVCGECGAQAMLFAAPQEYRAAVPVFAPQPQALAALQQRVRTQFDPAGIFNPGIMG